MNDKNGKTKLIFWLLGLLIALIGTLWGYTVVSQGNRIDIVSGEIKNHEERQVDNEMKVAETLGRIDERLANIERAVGVNNKK